VTETLNENEARPGNRLRRSAPATGVDQGVGVAMKYEGGHPHRGEGGAARAGILIM
jgi:hypothetical protein